MSSYILFVLNEVWDSIFEPPLNWLMSQSSEWKVELALFAALVLFWRRVAELYVVGGDELKEFWKEIRRSREWYHYAAMDEGAFNGILSSYEQSAVRQERQAS